MSTINTNNTGNNGYMSPYMGLRKDDPTAKKQAELLENIREYYGDISSNGGKTVSKDDIKAYFEANPTDMSKAEVDQFLSSKPGSLGAMLFKEDDQASEKEVKGLDQNVRDHKILDLIYKHRIVLAGEDKIIGKKDLGEFFGGEGKKDLEKAGLTEEDIKDFVENTSHKSGLFGASRTANNNIGGLLFGKDGKADLEDLGNALERVSKADGDYSANGS